VRCRFCTEERICGRVGCIRRGIEEIQRDIRESRRIMSDTARRIRRDQQREVA